MGHCKFNDGWLTGTDKNGFAFKDWLRKQSETHGYCTVCNKAFSVQKGHIAVAQHSNGEYHKSECRTKLSPGQLRLAISSEGPNSNASAASSASSASSASALPSTVKVFDVRRRTTVAELIWTMKVVVAGYSAASCDGVVSTFKGMFGDGVPENFSLSSTKLKYLVTDGLAPYLREEQRKDVDGVFYTLWYDETTNAANKKELQTGVRYWSKLANAVVSEHLQTFFIGSATGKDLAEKLDTALKNSSLPYSNLIMIGSDGPNVNKTVWNILNRTVLLNRRQGLLNVGTCNIHVAHNGFRKALEAFGDDVSDLVLGVYNFLDGWPTRLQDFEEIQSKLGVCRHAIIKHVPSRWLTLEPASDRMLEQWDVCQNYFLKHIPKFKSHLIDKVGYQNIVKLLKKPTMKAELMFVSGSAKIFASVTRLFQKEEPLIHILYEQMESVVDTLVRRSCKSSDHEDVFTKANLLSPEDVIIACNVEEELKDMSPKERTVFKFNAQKHYTTAAKYLMAKSSLKSGLVKAFRCLHPKNREESQSLHDIVVIAKAMPFQERTDVLQDEWRLLALLRIDERLSAGRVDHYWRHIFEKTTGTNAPMFQNITKVVKAALTVSHGNADVERLFSSSARTLTDDKASMSERTLNAFLVVKEHLKKYENKPENVPISPELLSMARVAYQKHRDYLEEIKKAELEKERKKETREKEIREKQERLRNIDQRCKALERDERNLLQLRKAEKDEKTKVDKLLSEASNRLKAAFEKKDMIEAGLSQAMLEGVRTVQRSFSAKRKECEDLQASITKRRSNILTQQHKLAQNKVQSMHSDENPDDPDSDSSDLTT